VVVVTLEEARIPPLAKVLQVVLAVEELAVRTDLVN
jgi:hypothetical protein